MSETVTPLRPTFRVGDLVEVIKGTYIDVRGKIRELYDGRRGAFVRGAMLGAAFKLQESDV